MGGETWRTVKNGSWDDPTVWERVDTMSTTKKTTTRPLTMRQTIDRLRYIANSPLPKYSGFHASTVQAAAAALHHIRRLQAALRAERRLRQTIISDENAAAALDAAYGDGSNP